MTVFIRLGQHQHLTNERRFIALMSDFEEYWGPGIQLETIQGQDRTGVLIGRHFARSERHNRYEAIFDLSTAIVRISHLWKTSPMVKMAG